MRVFFLGAGASKAMAGLPMMTEFFDDFQREDAIQYWALNWFIKQNKHLFSDNDEGKKINLEKLFNYLFLCLNPFADIYSEQALDFSLNRLFIVEEEVINRGAKVNEELSYFSQEKPTLRSFLLNIQEQLERYMFKKLHFDPGIDAKKLVEQLEDGDCIITTNYDLLIDWALKRYKEDMWKRSRKLIAGEPLFPEEKERGKGLYLKLHGSLNWFVCPNKECPNHFRIFVKEKVDESYYCERCGRTLKRLIIPPIFYKNIQDYPKLGFIWDIAFERLSKADEIIFYGFSFAPSDFPISWLLRETYTVKRKNSDADVYKEHMESQKIRDTYPEDIESSKSSSEEEQTSLREIEFLPKIFIINPDKNVVKQAEGILGLGSIKKEHWYKWYKDIGEYYELKFRTWIKHLKIK